ncbi:MAG: YitT family protein [Candidatus Limivivens sp.]|nr:YitT family protein [Candidatus Limivivens sp.]
MAKKAPSKAWKMAGAIFGVFLYAAAYRVILVPLNLYSGGFTGVAQIIQILLKELFHITLPPNIDFTGIFLWTLNIPLFFLAWKTVSRTFFLKTLVTVCLQSFFMSVIPAPETPLISDTLTSCLIGGAISGFGVGITLKYGSSGGGTDILGIYCAKNFPDFSVGKLTLLVNAVIYSFSALNDSLETAVYSIIFCFVASMIMDKVHYQNIMTCAMIMTNNHEIGDQIIARLNRSCTTWTGYGGYRKQPLLVIMTVISKYESRQLKQIVRKMDPGAFITFNDRMEVIGNFEKRFDA